jgi:hypothetical protein
MAFSIRNLTVLSYGNGFTLWHVQFAEDDRIGNEGYFADAADLIRPGDMALVTANGKSGFGTFSGEGRHIKLSPVTNNACA